MKAAIVTRLKRLEELQATDQFDWLKLWVEVKASAAAAIAAT